MHQTIVLGGGMVGGVMALDLAADPGRSVTLIDANEDSLAAAASQNADLRTEIADLSCPATVRGLAERADLIVGALPSRLGFEALKAVIATGRPYCDISFMPEDAWKLDELAKASGSVAVIDCGVAPGMSNLCAGLATHRLNPCRSIVIRVGGLPLERTMPWQYKAAFSPSDVIEEYLRPARVVQGSKVIIREALSEPVLIDFPETGTLEAFNTDGLRSLTETLDVPDMLEQTLRYPGHRDLVWALREAGMLSEDPVEVDGQLVTPRDLTCNAIFPSWTYESGEVDLTVMRVEAEGDLDGAPVRLTWDLYDQLDPETGWTSMARTTAFPATIMARQLEAGRVVEAGVHPPELLASNEALVQTMFEELQARGVCYRETITPLDH